MKMPTGISMIVMGVIHFCKFPKIAIFPKVNVIYVPPKHAFFFSAFQLISFFSLHKGKKCNTSKFFSKLMLMQIQKQTRKWAPNLTKF